MFSQVILWLFMIVNYYLGLILMFLAFGSLHKAVLTKFYTSKNKERLVLSSPNKERNKELD